MKPKKWGIPFLEFSVANPPAQLLDILAAHPDVYFQVFTNGHFITDEVAKRLRALGNVTPLISVKGLRSLAINGEVAKVS